MAETQGARRRPASAVLVRSRGGRSGCPPRTQDGRELLWRVSAYGRHLRLSSSSLQRMIETMMSGEIMARDRARVCAK